MDLLHVFRGPNLLRFPCRFYLEACLTTLGRVFPKSMAKPAPLSPFDLTIKRVLPSASPYVFVGDPVLPSNVEYVLETSVHKACCLCGGTWWCARSHSHTHVEDGQFGLHRYCCWCPDLPQGLADAFPVLVLISWCFPSPSFTSTTYRSFGFIQNYWTGWVLPPWSSLSWSTDKPWKQMCLVLSPYPPSCHVCVKDCSITIKISMSFSCWKSVHGIPRSCVVLVTMQSIVIRKRRGDRRHLRHTPVGTLKWSARQPWWTVWLVEVSNARRIMHRKKRKYCNSKPRRLSHQYFWISEKIQNVHLS